jgi:hypothetical protein
VGASFDAPLPLPTLGWKNFERFCLSLLRSLHPDSKQVFLYGREGENQKGVDLQLHWPHGERWTFQSKRREKFRTTDLQAVINEHKIDSQKKILLLSRKASVDLRDALATHPDWEIWDQEDLSQRFRSLDRWDQHRLIDTYFPGRHCELTGKLPSQTWLDPDDFFRPFRSNQAQFHHCWEVVGRSSERERLREVLADQTVRVIGLIGGPGVGKTRLLIDVLDHIKNSQTETRIVIACGQRIDPTDLTSLGRSDTLMVVEDAQDLEHLDPLCRHLLQKANARLLLACHPDKTAAIQASLAKFNLNGAAYQAIILERPSKGDAEALARQVLEHHGGDQRLATIIAARCQDSPLALVIGAQLVALEGLDPNKFASSRVFQDTVWSRYIRRISISAADGAGVGPDVDRVRRMLLLIALLQPLDPDSAGVIELLEDRHQIQPPEATRLTKSLLQSGVLVQRGSHCRLSPDLLADALIIESCITSRGSFNAYPEQLFHRAPHPCKGHLLVNLSHLEWRLREPAAARRPGVHHLWNLIDGEAWPPPSLLKAAIAAAFYQPQCALALAQRLIQAGHGSQPEVCRLIQAAVSSGEQQEVACELLWALARSDGRDSHHHPNHPLRALQELACPITIQSQHDVEAVVAFALRLLPWAESWSGVCTPFAILEGALRTTAHHLQSKAGSPMEIVTHFYRVNPGAIRPLRRHVIDAILDSLSATNRRQAFAAAELLDNALRYPDGPSDQPPSELELVAWTEEFQDTLQRLNARLDRHRLPSPALVRVAQSVARFSFPTKGSKANTGLAAEAEAVLARMDRDLPTRLCRHLMDGWCYLTWNRQESARDHLHQDLAADLEHQQPDSNALIREINATVADIASVSPRTWQGQAAKFITILLSRQHRHAEALLALMRSDPSAPLAAFAPHALAILLNKAPLQAHAWIEESPAPEEIHRRLMASAYAQGGFEERALLPRDRAWLEQLFCIDDPETLRQLPLIVHRLVSSEPRLAIDLITSAHLDLLSSANQQTHATAEILIWLGDEEHGIPLEQINPADAEGLLRLLQAPATLNDPHHHLRDFLKRIAPRWPELVLNLTKDRLERCLNEPSRFSLPCWYQHHPSDALDLLVQPQGAALFTETLDWGLARADQASFRDAWANLMACLFGWSEPQLSTTLWKWWQNAPQSHMPHLQLLAALLGKAPERFAFEQHAFVADLMLSVSTVDRRGSDWLVDGLAATVRRPVRWRGFREPRTEDLALAADAQRLHDRFPEGHPARRLYATIRDQAKESIASDGEADRWLMEV